MGHISKEKFNEIVKNAKCWDDIIRGCNLKTMTRSLQRRLNKIDHSHLPNNFEGLYSKLGKYTKEYYEQLVNNSKSWDDILENLKYTSSFYIKTIKNKFDTYNIDYSHLTYPNKTSNGKKNLKDILIENSMYSSGHGLKQKLKEELGWKHECLHCGKSTFSNLFVKDIPIPIELDHINGVHNDNRIENLRFLCPICHSLTETYKGKNMTKTKQNKKIKEAEDLTNEIIDPNIITEIEKINKKCLDCDKDISNHSTRCIDCNYKNKFIEALTNRPSYEQLKKDFEELKYYTTIAKKYNVSDNAIRKWMKKYEKYFNENIT